MNAQKFNSRSAIELFCHIYWAAWIDTSAGELLNSAARSYNPVNTGMKSFTSSFTTI